MYDLTAFLTTIAGASASIVAILGGFIASKLLPINGERDSLISKIKEIEEQKAFKEEELKEILNRIDQGDALSFIRKHIDEILDEKSVQQAYTPNEQHDISLDVLTPYWKKALELRKEIFDYYNSEEDDCRNNSDNIPNVLAEKYKSNDFDYKVCKMLVKRIQKLLNRQKYQTFMGEIIGFPDITPADLDVVTVEGSNRNSDIDKSNELQSELAWMELQYGQYLEQKKVLKKPKGMIVGLVIFALFSLGCIIIPLILTPRYFNNLQDFWSLKRLVLGIFIVGLAAIFGYLVYMLKWNEESASK